MSTTHDSLTLRPYRSDDRPAVLELLTASLAGGPTGERTAAFFDWKHRANVFGPSAGMVATDDDRVVGVRLFLRWELLARGRRYRAVRAVDTATHPDYLRRGIFTRLTMQLLAELERADEVDLVFNTPNAASRPGYLRMGWHEVGTLPVHVCPARPVRFARGLAAARRATAAGTAADVPAVAAVPPSASHLAPAGSAFDDLDRWVGMLEGTAAEPRLHTPLSVDYLRWRYAAAPGLDYRCIAVERHGELRGLAFGRLRSRAGLVELTLGDVLTTAGDDEAVRQVLREARRSGADHVTVHAPADTPVARQLLRCGYLPVPRAGIRLVTNPRAPMAVPPTEVSGWRLSLGDLEVF